MQRHAKRATIAVPLGAICSTVGLLVAPTGSASATVVLGSSAFAKPYGEGWGSSQRASDPPTAGMSPGSPWDATLHAR